MTTFTENERETFISIPTWPCESPEVVVCDSIVAPELGTYPNPIVNADDLAPLGSASNPIVIHVDEGWCRDEPDQLDSDADTEVMATPEFWGTLTGGNIAVPVSEEGARGFSSVSTRLPVWEDTEGFQPFEQSTPSCFQSDHKALKVTEHSSDSSRECPRLGIARRGNGGGSEPGTEQDKAPKTEESKGALNVPASMIRNAVPQEIPIQTDTSFGKGLPCDWPEVVVCDSIVVPELGTQANPTVIGDDLAPLGSASNSIVI